MVNSVENFVKTVINNNNNDANCILYYESENTYIARFKEGLQQEKCIDELTKFCAEIGIKCEPLYPFTSTHKITL